MLQEELRTREATDRKEQREREAAYEKERRARTAEFHAINDGLARLDEDESRLRHLIATTTQDLNKRKSELFFSRNFTTRRFARTLQRVYFLASWVLIVAFGVTLLYPGPWTVVAITLACVALILGFTRMTKVTYHTERAKTLPDEIHQLNLVLQKAKIELEIEFKKNQELRAQLMRRYAAFYGQ